MSKYLAIHLIQEPFYVETSPAGVKIYEGEWEIEGKILPISKLSYEGWDCSSIFFDWQEPIEDMMNNSIIKKIDKAIFKSGLKHTLGDYGIINREEFEKMKRL